MLLSIVLKLSQRGCILSKINNHTLFQGTKQEIISLFMPHTYMRLPYCYYWLWEIKKYSVWMASNSIMFIPSFIPTFSWFKRWYGNTQTTWRSHRATSFLFYKGTHTQHNTTHHNISQHNTTHHNISQHNITQQITTQHNISQHNISQHNTSQHNISQHNTSQHNISQHNTSQHITTQHNMTTQCNTTQHITTQHITTQHITTHDTTQHNTTHHNTMQHNMVCNIIFHCNWICVC